MRFKNQAQRRAVMAKLQYTHNYTLVTKKVTVPPYNPGIAKQRDGFVVLSGWDSPGWKSKFEHKGRYISKVVRIPRDAGLSRLVIGKKTVSKAV